MFKRINNYFLAFASGLTVSVILSADAQANDVSSIATNVSTSVEDLPGLITGGSYICGVLLSVLGILSLKKHVENPGNTPLNEGIIRLLAAGALFALAIITEAFFNTIGSDQNFATVATANKFSLGVQ